MGFLDVASKVGKFALDTGKVVAEGMNEQAEQLRETQAKYSDKSDEELLKISKNDRTFGNTSSERAIAKKILKGRGVEL